MNDENEKFVIILIKTATINAYLILSTTPKSLHKSATYDYK